MKTLRNMYDLDLVSRVDTILVSMDRYLFRDILIHHEPILL